MPVEQREQVTRVETVRVNGQPEELAGFGGRRQPSLGGTSRMNREVHVRICERLGVKFPGATRQVAGQGRCRGPSALHCRAIRQRRITESPRYGLPLRACLYAPTRAAVKLRHRTLRLPPAGTSVQRVVAATTT